MQKGASIRVKIIVPFIVIIIFTLSVITIVSLKQQVTSLSTQQEKKALIFVKSLADSLEEPLSFQLIDKLQEIVAKAKGTDSDIVWIGIIDSSGKCLVSSDVSSQGKVLQDVFDRESLKTEKMSVRKVPGKKHVFEVSVPMITSGGKRFLLRVQFSRADIFIETKRLGVIYILIALLSLILVTIVYFLIVQRAIIKPILMTKEVAGKIAEGDLTQYVDSENISRDELGELATTFNSLMDNLHHIVVEIRDTSDKVNTLAQGLSTSADEMNASTEEISNVIQGIAQGIMKQAKRIEDTANIMDKMVSSVKQIAINVNESSKTSQRTANLAQEGAQHSEEAVRRTTEITRVAGEITSVVGRLGERSKEIGRIVEVITNIADQTNLLALNAAIEAARAGEAGRGFAVVAEEVRKLAENSAQAAEQIAVLIRTIQEETSVAVSSVEKATREVEKGKVGIEKVREYLESILKAAERTAIQIEQIAAAAEIQLANAQEVKKAIEEVTAIAEGSSSATEGASSSVEEMTASMEEMAATAQELARMSDNLQGLVRKFKVRG